MIVFTHVVEDNIFVELHNMSNDMLRAVVVVVVRPNTKSSVIGNGHEMFLEAGAILKCGILRAVTVFRQ